jgi:hypothetical protein
MPAAATSVVHRAAQPMLAHDPAKAWQSQLRHPVTSSTRLQVPLLENPSLIQFLPYLARLLSVGDRIGHGIIVRHDSSSPLYKVFPGRP